VTTGASRWIATLAPVERIGTICRLRGVARRCGNGLAPIRNRASSAKWMLSARDCVSERIAAVSPDFDRAALENLAERVDPFRFDAIRQHALSPLTAKSSCPASCRASTS